MINRRILVSLMVIGIVGAVAGSGTLAYFNDTESSTGNTFTSGSIDLEFGYANGDSALIDFNGEPAFSISDMKPGDTNETTFAFEVSDNPSYVCAAITDVEDNEVSVTEPEADHSDEGNSVGDGFVPNEGELAGELQMTAWVDDGDNIYNEEDGDRIIGGFDETPVPADGSSQVLELVDSSYNAFGTDGEALSPNQRKFIAVNVTLPSSADNLVQTDEYVADLHLYATQSRNQEGFECENLAPEDIGADTTLNPPAQD